MSMVLVEHEQEGLHSRSAYVPDDTLRGEDAIHCHIFRRPEFECKRRMGCFGGLVRDPLRGIGELGTDNELPAAVRVVEERTVDEEEILDTLQDEPVPHRRHRVPRDDVLMYARFSKSFETVCVWGLPWSPPRGPSGTRPRGFARSRPRPGRAT